MAEAISINEQIRLLIELQEYDARIYRLAKEKEQLPLEIVQLQKAFDDKQARLCSLEENSKSFALKRKEKEVDMASQEEKIKKFNSQLLTLKTNKEYHAMLAQITSLKTDNSLLEEEILKIMDEQDGLKEEITKEKAHLAEEEKRFQVEKKKAESRIQEVESSIADLTVKRNHSVPSVEKRVFLTYERVLKAKEGLALVRVKNFACQGCHMSVTPQVVNEIKMQEKIITCESCARILYLEEDI